MRLLLTSLAFLALTSPLFAQKWVNPAFDAHRLDYRELGYPDVTQIPADNSPITALVTAADGTVYGATSGKQSCLFLYNRSTNKVRPLGRIGDEPGVHHAILEGADGKIYLGTGLNVLAAAPLTQEFRGGFRAIEEQLWKDIAAPYAKYAGGHLYRYDPKANSGVRMPDTPCPLEDLGIPVARNSIYALAFDPARKNLFGITYPDARLFRYDLEKRKSQDLGELLQRKVYSGPERTWRSVPRALWTANPDRVYTSGEDGRIVFYDLAAKRLERTPLQIPGEYWEAWNYHGYPVVEQFVADPDGQPYATSSDGFLFRLNLARNELTNLGKPRVSRRVRAMALGPDHRLYLVCGEFQEPCKLFSYDLSGKEGFRDWGVMAVDRSPHYAKRAYQFDAICRGIDGTIFLGESDRRACLFLFFPGAVGFEGGFNPTNPR